MTIYRRFRVLWLMTQVDMFNSFHVIDKQIKNVFIIYVYRLNSFIFTDNRLFNGMN